MTIADTSAWIEFLRGTGSAADRRLTQLVEEQGDLAITDVVVMELLAGAKTDSQYGRIRRLLARFELAGVESPWDYVAAADVHRACRAAGKTIRAMNDCIIAAVAMRINADVLHQDRDYDAIAQHTALRISS